MHEPNNMLYNIPNFIAGVSHDKYLDSVTHTSQSQEKNKVKNKIK
jgi:hypothetical protein